MEGITDLFRCFICMDKLKDARLCPHCSKLCCFPCIYRWLVEQRSQCPHCRLPLHPHELINCRWVSDVTQQLENLQLQCTSAPSVAAPVTANSNAASDLCTLHNEKLSVYCGTCKVCICHKCALWEGTHSGHSFQPVDKMYEAYGNKIKEGVSQLRRRLLEITNLIQDVERNVELVRSAKDDKVREIRHAVELIVSRLDSQLRNKLLSLVGQKNVLTQETEQLESLIQETESALQNESKSHLIGRSGDLLCELHRAQRKMLSAFTLRYVPADFQSEIVPPYTSSTFTIEGFSNLRNNAEPIYSPPLLVDGLKWRLKVYPDGNGIVRGNYLSVFLELTSGVTEPAKYEYRVELIYQGPPNSGGNRNIVREFASEFDAGECWGYNRFFRLDLLTSEGYLLPETNSLVLRFHVRPPTYYQKCRDLQRYLNNVLQRHARYVSAVKHFAESGRNEGQLPQAEEEESVELRSTVDGTESSTLPSTTSVNLSTGPNTSGTFDLPTGVEEQLLSDEVFDDSPSQRFLRVSDSVSRLTRNFQINPALVPEDGEWVSTSSESGTVSFGNDNVVDDGNLSEGELELSEAVISVNQYVIQSRNRPLDGNSNNSGLRDGNVTYPRPDYSFMDLNRTTVLSPNMSVHSFAERDFNGDSMETPRIVAVPEEEPVRTSTRMVGCRHQEHRRKNRRARDDTFLLPRVGTSRRRSISPPRSHAPTPTPAPAPEGASNFLRGVSNECERV